MKNLEKTLLENILRFGAKNLNTELIKPLLYEQTDYVLRWEQEKAAADAFRAWENENRDSGRVKLVKTNGYKPAMSREIIVPATFWNNFVTIDSMTNSAEIKQQIDQVLETLQQQGANLDDPTLDINIISRATSPVASITPNPKDNTGKKQIDHNYNGLLKFDANGNVTPESKAAFDAKQKTDPQWGNKILAQKRGDAAANYIKSKGIKAKVTVVPEINADRREFVITARTIGKEKFVAPLNAPDIKLTLKIGATWVVSPAKNIGGAASAYILPLFTYYGSLTTSTGVKIDFRVEDTNKGGYNADNDGLRWLRKQELYKMTTSYERNPLYARGGNGDGTEGGQRIRAFFGGCGYFDQRSASYVVELITQGAGKLISTMTGFNAIEWLNQSSKIVDVTKDVSFNIEQFRGIDFYGKLITPEEVAKYQQLCSQTSKTVEQTYNLQQLASAAAASGIAPVSTEISKYPKFWTNAEWMDATTTPVTSGSNLVKNIGFFQGIDQFNTSPINK
jgi:hypothetical protein